MPYAKSRPELKDYSDAQIARDILDSAAWREVMRPILKDVDRQRARPGKVKPYYTSEELESVLLMQIVSGAATVSEIRNRLAGDRGHDARRLLGLERPRPLPGERVIKLRSGIPSEATLSRHRAAFGEKRRLAAYKALERRLLTEHAATEELRQEALVLDMDGSPMLTHYTAPVLDPRTGQLVNDGLSERGYPKITAPDAGYLPKSAGFEKTGHGWNLVMVATQTGVVLTWRLVPLNNSEKTVALELLDELGDILPLLGRAKLRVLTADGGFTKRELRAQARGLGIIENIHTVSHTDSDRAKANAAKNDQRRIRIEGYKSWFTNGHRELVCKCGKGRSVKRVKLGPKATAIVRNEGQCATCGPITITSGDWYLAQNPDCWRRVSPFDREQRRIDYLMGNPLTFNDPVSAQYGNRRFGHNEGLHGALCTRFGLIDGKRWFRRGDQGRTAVAMTMCVMHAVALAQRRRARAAQAQAPPLAA